MTLRQHTTKEAYKQRVLKWKEKGRTQMFAKCRILTLIMLSSLMAGCGLIDKNTTFIDTGCDWTKTITASRQDTEETKKQILAHDIERQKHCE